MSELREQQYLLGDIATAKTETTRLQQLATNHAIKAEFNIVMRDLDDASAVLQNKIFKKWADAHALANLHVLLAIGRLRMLKKALEESGPDVMAIG